MRSLELAGATPQVRNQSLAAIKRFAREAGDLGWIDPTDAARICQIRQKRVVGVKLGRWITLEQVKMLFAAIDRTTPLGRRDAAILALLVGCGLRRSEAVSLHSKQVVESNGRMVLANVQGKGGRIRNVAVPSWAANIIREWQKEIAQ